MQKASVSNLVDVFVVIVGVSLVIVPLQDGRISISSLSLGKDVVVVLESAFFCFCSACFVVGGVGGGSSSLSLLYLGLVHTRRESALLRFCQLSLPTRHVGVHFGIPAACRRMRCDTIIRRVVLQCVRVDSRPWTSLTAVTTIVQHAA